ncbi:MAG: hypothetical protein AABZ47_13410 [Planctomycetota bacterium]
MARRIRNLITVRSESCSSTQQPKHGFPSSTTVWCVGSLQLLLFLCAGQAVAQSGGDYDLTWNTVDSGGQMFSEGSGYELGGTVGQSDAGFLTGGVYELTGGFWAAHCIPGVYADLDYTDLVDVDDLIILLNGFIDPVTYPDGDIYPCGVGDGIIDVDDLIALLEAFAGVPICPAPCR